MKVDAVLDRQIHEILVAGIPNHPQHILLHSFSTDSARFKKAKPYLLLFPDGSHSYATSWRQVLTEIMANCNRDPIMHERLMQIRDHVNGRLRPFLTSSPDNLDFPIKIDEGLYLEGKFDTEYLLKMAKSNIFDPIGYDYEKIGIAVRGMEQAMPEQMQEQKM